MPFIRCQVAVRTAEVLARDDIVNTFYLDQGAPFVGIEYQTLADDIAELWATYRVYPAGVTSVQVRLYDMADAEPREPRAEATQPLTGNAGGAPREVALCLSFFRGRNLPRLRGRLYIGPWRSVSMALRPDSDTMGQLQTLAEGLQALGGPDVDWVQYSPTTSTHGPVTDWWVDNEWDTVRSRGFDGTSRIVGTTSE